MPVRIIRFRTDTGDAEVTDSRFGAFHISIWAAMMRKHFPQFFDSPLYPLISEQQEMEPWKEAFWGLIRDNRVSTHERLVLGMTYDKFVVRRKDLDALASAVEQFAAEHLNDEFNGNPPKKAMLQLASSLRQEAINETTAAIGMDQGDSTDSPWFGEHEEELEKPQVTRYNINKNSGHKFLFQEVQG